MGFAGIASAQISGEIKGAVTDQSGQGLKGVFVDILDATGARTGRGAVTDVDGRYGLIDLRAGTYDVQYYNPHFVTVIVKAVIVGTDEATLINMDLRPASGKKYEVLQYVKPLINGQDTRLEQRVTQENIHDQNVNDLAAQMAGVEQRDAGSPITIEGSHPYEVQYMFNGIPLMNSLSSAGHGRP